ncbi:methyltransferase [Dehalogenimonas sp. THU2]|uniref:methyltransferase n=1 Tax=Dehalogenimonas sp. THU2 TaxID=3151121 RepID=UPI003218C4E4
MGKRTPDERNEVEGLLTAQALTELGWQFRISRTFLACHQLGIFEALRVDRSAAQVAGELQINPEMTEKLLIALCALKILNRDGGEFSLTELGRDTLLLESLRYIGGVLDFDEHMWWEWSILPDLARGGEAYTKRHRLMKQLQQGAGYILPSTSVFPMAMHGKAINGGAQFMAANIDLSDRRLLLDIGGGPGTYAIVLCERFSKLKAVIWDTMETLEIAQQVIKHFGLEDRITTRSGDWDTDEFGPVCDTILLSNVAHGPESNAEGKLVKAFRVLEPGGLLIVQEFLLNNEKNGPLPAALFNIMVGAYSEEELIKLVDDAGFSEVKLVARDNGVGSGIITAIKPGVNG